MCEVSVIVPVYNVEKYIANTLNSILNQTFRDIEVIIVDDGSTDNSIKICEEFKDPRIKIYKKDNGGASSARNYGIYKAKGKYLTFIDSDDLYESNYINNMYQYKEYDLVICGIRKVINGNDNNIFAEFEYKDKEEITNNIINIINSSMLNSPVNKLYHKEIITQNELLFDCSMEIGEDYNFNFKYLSHCQSVKCIRDCLYVYLVRNNSISSKRIKNIIEKRKINIDLTEDYLMNNNIDHSLCDNMKLKLIYIALMQNDVNKKEDIYNDYFKNLKVTGLSNKILYFMYKLHSLLLLKIVAKLMIFVRSKTKISINQASM